MESLDPVGRGNEIISDPQAAAVRQSYNQIVTVIPGECQILQRNARIKAHAFIVIADIGDDVIAVPQAKDISIDIIAAVYRVIPRAGINDIRTAISANNVV